MWRAVSGRHAPLDEPSRRQSPLPLAFGST
jgi:hypothetical protein